MRRTIAKVVTLAIAGLVVDGCSFLFVRQAPPEDAWPRIVWADCSDSMLAPLADTLFAASGALSSVSAASQGNGAILPSTLTTLAVWGASAVYGWIHTSKCGELRAYMGRRSYEQRWSAPGRALPPSSSEWPASTPQQPTQPPPTAP